MRIVNEVLGTPERFKALLDMDIEGPVSMPHLLKFRQRGSLEDGRATDQTGAEAYQVYLRTLADRVQSAGGQVVLSKPTRRLVLGQAEDLWDKETFVDIVTSPEISASGVHRRAGPDGQLLIALGGSNVA